LKDKRRTGANFVILGEEDWRTIEDSIYLNRVPGLVEGIHLSADISSNATIRLCFSVFL
jgi:PHD/YefM family antitoxin component YafN of YafNO toxin-antitoxin module